MFKKSAPAQKDLEIFSIFDSKTKSYGNPNFAPNHEVLIRDIANMFRDPTQAQNKLLINAEDYSVFRIGTYDNKSGQITSQLPEHVINMHDLRAATQTQTSSSPHLGIVPT